MNEKKRDEWHFDFGLCATKSKQFISESQCNELLDLIVRWAENNDLSVGGGYRGYNKPKYTLSQLIEKCDEKAPMPPELADWDKIKPAGSEVW